MSKSLGNAIGLTEPASDMYGKLMSVSDETMWVYFELLTRLPSEEISSLRAGHPMEAKKRLARTVTARYHGETATRSVERAFEHVFQHRGTPPAEDLEVVRVALSPTAPASPSLTSPSLDGGTGTGRLLRVVIKEAGFVSSTSEARRRIQEGAVEVDQRRVSDLDHALPPGAYVIRVGRRFKRVILEA
jgi:tyrosyl-tRNA synthetase